MIETLFPTFIYHEHLVRKIKATRKSTRQLNRELLHECIRYSEIDHLGNTWSNKNYKGGYTSFGSLSNLHKLSSTFAELEKNINQHVYQFIESLEMDIKAKSLQMTNCWINIMPAKVNHSMHIHPLSVISGTYYVNSPKNCSGLKFEDPRLANFMCSPPRKARASRKNQRFYEYTPKEGHLVLFESWTRHEVASNQSETPRVSISFNYNCI